MDHHDRRILATQLTQHADEIRARMSGILAEFGFVDLEVTEFRVSPLADQATRFRTLATDIEGSRMVISAAPCPSTCVLTPDGHIHCSPQC
jgi:hypothetical protein